MTELTVGQLIKIIIGVLVFVVVVAGVAYFFKNSVIDFFSSLGGNSTGNLIVFILK